MCIAVVRGCADHEHVGLCQLIVECIYADHAQRVGVGLGRPPDADNLCAEGARSSSNVLADAAVAEDHPARAIELTKRKARPCSCGLGLRAFDVGVERRHDLRHDVFGNGDAAAVVDGQANAGREHGLEGRVLITCRTGLEPAHTRRGEHLLHIGPDGRAFAEEQVARQPCDLEVRIVGRLSRDGRNGSVVLHDERLDFGARLQFALHGLVAVAADEEFHAGLSLAGVLKRAIWISSPRSE